ncbi:MAG: TetR/AcrR family transcriptional regulator, partial [Actinomycetota bacterium]
MTTRGFTEDAKGRLLRAGERLFAEQGIHRVRLRELHQLAGQRNASALHYHFGTRHGLVDAIIAEHWAEVAAVIGRRLDERPLDGDATVRQVLEAAVPALAGKLLDESGRYFLRIVPQLLPQLSRNFRRGRFVPATSETTRVLGLLDRAMSHQSEAIRRERLVGYALILITLLADRADGLDRGHDMVLDHDTFVVN